MRERLREMARWTGVLLALRCLQRFQHIDGRNRSLALAGQAFTTLVPMLIIAASIAGPADGRVVGESLVSRFHLTGDSADAMRTLFARPPDAAGTVSLIGLVLLLASLMSLTRSLQRVYEAAWGLPPRGIPGTVNGLAGMSLLVTQLIVLTMLASLLRGLPAATFITLGFRLLAAIPLWLLLQYLLLGRRVPARRLLPGAVLTAAGQVTLMLVSAYWMPIMIASNAARYGLIGVTLAMISWLVVIALGIIISAVVSVEIAGRRSPGPDDQPEAEVGGRGVS